MSTETDTANVRPEEIQKFSAIASRWWDPEGPVATLHQINPIRLDFIQNRLAQKPTKILDIGCGGGLLSEGLSALGHEVTAIDLSKDLIETAKLHQLKSGTTVDYHCCSLEDFSAEHSTTFDAITCLELLEHVPAPEQFILQASKLLNPGGSLFVSTLNRNLKSFLFSIVGAEYILRLLDKGTHDYASFIKPSELAAVARSAHLSWHDQTGIGYNPLNKQFYLTPNIDVNYLVQLKK